jgi:23S rRNA pseudouridine1911/1915/1917 synthase
MRVYEFSVGRAEAGARLDRYLIAHLPASISRAMVQRRIREGLVTVSGRGAKSHQKLKEGDAVSIRIDELPPPSRDLPMTPQDIPLEVVHEDAAVIVVNKPVGLVTHPAPGHWDGTLMNALLYHFQRSAGEGPHTVPARAGIVHRLDKDTSGLLLVAKTESARAVLARQMKARTITRRYLAIVEGLLPLDQGTVRAPLGRHPKHRKEMAVRHLGGRDAVTHYRVLKRFNGEPFSCTLIEVSLETGRTHQIRVHLASVGHPVAGDVTYGKRPAAFWESVGVPRHLLHAYRLSFQHPVTGRPVDATAPVPPDFSRWWNASLLPGN